MRDKHLTERSEKWKIETETLEDEETFDVRHYKLRDERRGYREIEEMR